MLVSDQNSHLFVGQNESPESYKKGVTEFTQAELKEPAQNNLTLPDFKSIEHSVSVQNDLTTPDYKCNEQSVSVQNDLSTRYHCTNSSKERQLSTKDFISNDNCSYLHRHPSSFSTSCLTNGISHLTTMSPNQEHCRTKTTLLSYRSHSNETASHHDFSSSYSRQPTFQTNSLYLKEGSIWRQGLHCDYCSSVLEDVTRLKEHNDTVHSAYTCLQCSSSFVNLDLYRQHIRQHGEHTFSSGHRLLSHPFMMNSNNNMRHMKHCGICGESFLSTKSATLIIQHLHNNHQLIQLFTCFSCHQLFPSRSAFVSHRRAHHTDESHCRCDQCDVYFTYSEFKQHERECHDDNNMEKIRQKMERGILYTTSVGGSCEPSSNLMSDKHDLLDVSSCDQTGMISLSQIWANKVLQLNNVSDRHIAVNSLMLNDTDDVCDRTLIICNDVDISENKNQLNIQIEQDSSINRERQATTKELVRIKEEPADVITKMQPSFTPKTNANEMVQKYNQSPFVSKNAVSDVDDDTNNNNIVVCMSNNVADYNSVTESLAHNDIGYSNVTNSYVMNNNNELHRLTNSITNNNNVYNSLTDIITDDKTGCDENISTENDRSEDLSAEDMHQTLHRQVTTNEIDYTCQVCEWHTNDERVYEQHCSTLHGRYVCFVCKQSFANGRNLRRHSRKHNGIKPYHCRTCGLAFERDDNLKRHVIRHHSTQRLFIHKSSYT